MGMREILFRGKRIDNGEWVMSGNLIHFNPEGEELHYYIPKVNAKCVCTHDESDNILAIEEGTFYKVVPETVGQFTGLTDKNGKRIFEGDVIKADNGNGPPAIAVVKFGENYPTMFYTMMDVLYPGYKRLPAISFYAESIGNHQHLILFQSPCVEVIGNIHDNPELIGERKDNG